MGWTEIPLTFIDSSLTREFMSRKGFFVSLDANKIAENGITDTAGPVTLLGLIATIECNGTAGVCVPFTGNGAITNAYAYRTNDDSIPVATTFVGP